MDSTPSLISQAALSCMCASTPAGAYGIGWRETDTERERVYDTDIYINSERTAALKSCFTLSAVKLQETSQSKELQFVEVAQKLLCK